MRQFFWIPKQMLKQMDKKIITILHYLNIKFCLLTPMNFWFQVSYMYKYSGKISFIENCGGSVVECLIRGWGFGGSSLIGGTVLCPWARHFTLCLVLVQRRNTCPDMTEKCWLGHKKSNQTNKWLIVFQSHKHTTTHTKEWHRSGQTEVYRVTGSAALWRGGNYALGVGGSTKEVNHRWFSGCPGPTHISRRYYRWYACIVIY